MEQATEATICVIAAFLVLLSAMWDPRVSAVVATTALAAPGIYKLRSQRH